MAACSVLFFREFTEITKECREYSNSISSLNTRCHNVRIMNLRIGLLSLLVAMSPSLHADDGAASIAAGGIIVMKREPRITMAKEVLQISAEKVVVDYNFRNDSDEDITTEVAFPIPDYEIDQQHNLSEQGFDDFHLWIEGMPATFSTETRAVLKNKDFTELLTNMHVDVPTFGHMVVLEGFPDVARLSASQRKQLAELGLIDRDDDFVRWQVRKKYYWQETFPAHKTVHIRHVYTPALGANNGFRYAWDASPDKTTTDELKSFCLDEQLHSKLESTPGNQDRGYVYVDFILTTANTWKTPIEDFTLIVKRPHSKNNQGKPETNYVSFCWDGPVTKINADHFSAHTTNFVPTKELRIGFLRVDPNKH
jgi:hypothetical protein